MDTRGPAPPQPPQQPPAEPRSPFDQALAAALRDVPTPDGLMDRLLFAVSQAASPPPPGLVEPFSKAVPATPVLEPAVPHVVSASPLVASRGNMAPSAILHGDTEPTFAASREGVQAESGQAERGQTEPGRVEPGRATPRRRRARLWWLARGVPTAAAAALLCWVALSYLSPVSRPTPDDLVALARSQMIHDLGAEQGWQDIAIQPSRDHPVTFQHVRIQRGARWRNCRLGGVSGVLLDLSQPGVKGALYVVPLAELSMPNQTLPRSPGRPIFTQGRSSSMWREGGYACLLIVEGDEQALRRLLKQPSPVAHRRPHVRMLAGSSTASPEERSSARRPGSLRPAARAEPARGMAPPGTPRGRRRG